MFKHGVLIFMVEMLMMVNIYCNKVHEPGNQSSSINAADSDIYDEEAERRAFQEAVGAWRKGGQTESQKSKVAVPTGNVSKHH